MLIFLDTRATAGPFDGNLLHWAVVSLSIEEVETILSSGVWTVDMVDRAGHTPLHYAAWQDNADMARLLIKWGANVLTKSYPDYAPNGQTPRQLCDAKGYAWCNLLNTDGLDRHYSQALRTTDENDLGSLTCSRDSDCPQMSQEQMQQLMALTGPDHVVNMMGSNKCQFYNMTCNSGQCKLGLTWNSFECIEDCNSYPLSTPLPQCPSSCPQLKCPCGCFLYKNGVFAGQAPVTLSALAGTRWLREVLTGVSRRVLSQCPPASSCVRGDKCCKPRINRRGQFLGCPKSCK